ncbi:lantibiotic dehydratase [Dyadobacter beijingensis]|uniref:Lantibiotic dehydratase n=1 Tax=Dyadobacter beijingensis TaxID=365489 RepID=A0ABQ2I3F1_9BACT|nr:lantibiotic dehydratase [Dyadobacter beijingensis]
MRRPRLPLDVLYEFNARVNNRAELFEKELIRFFSQPAMLEAIYLASPELYDSFTGLVEGRVKTGTEKLLKTLYKYLVRMTSRSTPYGLFAGCAVGTPGPETRIEFDPTDPEYTHARLDMNYVAGMADALLEKPGIRAALQFSVNTSLYRIGDTYRYVESTWQNEKRSYVLASVDSNEYLDGIIARARTGATIGELARRITGPEISREEALQYIDALIDAQILVSELAATVTGDEFFQVLKAKLSGMDAAAEEVAQMGQVADLLAPGNGGVAKYGEVGELVNRHFVTTGSKDLIQADLFYNTRSCTIGERAIGTLLKEYADIQLLGYQNPMREMDQFKKRFLERYEQREMPLLEVLDSESGIGYGDVAAGRADNLPLLDDLHLPDHGHTPAPGLSPLARFREKLCGQAARDHSTAVRLTDAMLQELRETAQPARIPDSFYLFGNLVAGSQQAVDEGDFKFVLNAMGGPSGLKLLGRFCHGNPQLAGRVRKAVAEEENCREDGIFAEIAHLPEARVGNVLMRPHFRQYEIPYLSGSSLPEENRIMPDDLMVSVSAAGEVILRSKRLNKRIFPRLTNAHNFTGGLPVYRFLCELTYQENYRYAGWHWDHLAANTFLPRVEYKHWILSRATWNLDKALFSKHSLKDIFAADEWLAIRKAYQIPRFVQLRQGDSELLIDGDSDFSVGILCETLRKYGQITLTEFLESRVLGEPGQHYLNEILIPFLHTQAPAPAKRDTPAASVHAGSARRNFITGSEWLYVKIYAGTKTVDRLLTTVVKPLADRLVADGTIEKWFFVRYEDPDYHIRLRFYHGSNPSFWHRVLAELNAVMDPLITDGIVHKIQTDTYKRELERYACGSYEEVESVFFADSDATAGFLSLISGDEGERYRWQIGLRAVDMLLNDLGFTLESKKDLMDRLQANFFQEFDGNTQLNIQLNDKYRAQTGTIERFLDPRYDGVNEIEEAIVLFGIRSERIRESMKIIGPTMGVSFLSFASSLVHMFLNRLFVSQQREHELVIYHYLKKYYGSRLARRKNVAKDVIQEGFLVIN